MKHAILIDKFDRQLNYLRVSITDRCNLRCIYCTPTGRIPKLRHEDILRYEELLRIIRIGAGLGITKVRVTGGEPLIRKGVCDFLNELSEMPELTDISLTTNAVLLEDNIQRIKTSGIHRINISLDSLDRERYRYLTGYDHFKKVWRGIEQACNAGFSPIKINIVALKGINDDEIEKFGRLSMEYPFHVRFIEYMPIGSLGLEPKDQLLAPEIKKRLERIGKLSEVKSRGNDGPAKRYHFEGAKGEIGLITAMSGHFCHQCNRLRLTANGQLRSCLLSDRQEDIRHLLRSGAPDREIARVFIDTARRKQKQHRMTPVRTNSVKSSMSGIGG